MQELLLLAGLLVVVSAVLAALGFRGRDQVVGIDLGTTFSVVALKSGNRVAVIPDYFTGRLLVPSVVSLLPNGSWLVGDSAVAERGRLPLHTVFNAKRFIGRQMREVVQDAQNHPFRVVGNTSAGQDVDEAEAGFQIPGDSGNLWLSPEDVGARVVVRLKHSVAEYLGYDISRAVICVPAKFSYRQIKATQQAFEQAGFKVMRILEEPTAAAVAYNLHKTTGVRHVLVYDIGGGTLDTSLLYMNGKSVSVLGVSGDDHLGGSDFDLRMRELLGQKLANATQAALELPPAQRCDSTGLAILAEEAKIQLSSVQRVEVQCAGADGSARIVPVTREEFERASEDLFQRSMKPVEAVLADQMMTPSHVDDVVLVGGASRTPKLRALLQDIMGPTKKLHTEIDPDITVAYGAANILD
mmetsp:Transcript_135927/g.378835  ORF Transcript_135927/g.378835 Transcript_135927/m.378835 type:complete len:412 (+) Transcript_135927:102-1337(+)